MVYLSFFHFDYVKADNAVNFPARKIKAGGLYIAFTPTEVHCLGRSAELVGKAGLYLNKGHHVVNGGDDVHLAERVAPVAL